MSLRKKKLLAVFLEKDSCKLVLYEIGGLKSQVSRVFAGQISFPPEVLRDGFIADSNKFSSQIKMAFAQKDTLKDAHEVICFLSPDKVFTKTMPTSDSIDSFIKGLPYFREELVIKSEDRRDRVTQVAFEKKLIEELQRPFLELDKKIIDVKSGANVLVAKFSQTGKYLFLIPLEKEMIMVSAQDGEVLDLVAVKNDVLPARIIEFMGSHGLADGGQVFGVGALPAEISGKQVVGLAQGDIYDLIVSSLSPVSPKIVINKRYLLLAGAAFAGILLVFGLIKGLSGRSVSNDIKTPVKPPEAAAPVLKPEPNKSDYPVAVYNGTSVTGEAGKLAEKLKAAGYIVNETKNATSSGFAASRLRAVVDTPEKFIDDLKTVLLTDYEAVNVETFASGSSKFLIEIIIGKKK